MKLTIPELSLVLLIGASGSGKSTFATRHFKPTEVLSSDAFRGLVADDETDQSATQDAFEVLNLVAEKRLAAGRLTVVDATNVQPRARAPLVALARRYHVLPVALVFDLPEKLCRERNRLRPGRNFPARVIEQQCQQLRRSLPHLKQEGFSHVFVLSSPEEVEAAVVERQPLWNNRRHEHGPFDIIGDVHGCFDELGALLGQLGYRVEASLDAADGTRYTVQPPVGRKAIFLGDLVDRGPRIPEVLRLVMAMVVDGTALCVPGNHDIKLMRKLRGRDVQVAHGMAESLTQLEPEPPEFKARVAEFLDGLTSHYVLDDGNLVVAHAGMKEAMQGRASATVRDFALYGETTGEIDAFGLPVRLNWAAEYRGQAMVVYGHTPVPHAEWLNRTINIDTGCVFGGALTALRYPEKELVSVPAARVYFQPARPFLAEGEPPPVLSAQQQTDEVLDLQDVLGRRSVSTRLLGEVVIQEEQAQAALEAMSRFAIPPQWLIYLPPTMSPCETSQQPGLLEHPAEAFAYYQRQGVARVICQEKHMGSRAIVVLCRDEATARQRFGGTDGKAGVCYTRTGRRFFTDVGLESEFLEQVGSAVTAAGLWQELATDWLCLDCELMPWSAKAQELLRQQYAAVGAAARLALAEVVAVLAQAEAQGVEVGTLREQVQERAEVADRYTDVYRRYCWPVQSVADLKLAPFHLLATEGQVHTDKNHLWHLETLARLWQAPGRHSTLWHPTAYQMVEVNDPASVQAGIRWWEELLARGGEGMVVKPLDYVARGQRGLVQPAVKCRGREYLRIIYGPEYTFPENLERLRERNLARKRTLALREFALGVEALERFVRHEPLYRVHECIFGVLAFESESIDPRL